MDPRFAAADAALKAKRTDEGVALLKQALTDMPKAPAQAYRALAVALHNAGRPDEVREWAQAGLEHHPRDFDLWNMLGVAFRRLRNTAEALKALDQAQKLNPKSQAPLINRINVLNDVGDPRALEGALKLVRLAPNVAEHHRMAAIAHRHAGELDKARTRLLAAVRLQPTLVLAWTDLLALESGLQNHQAASDALDRALAANPDSVGLKENRAILLRRAGRRDEARRYLEEALAKGDASWIRFQLGRTLADEDRAAANAHLRRAVELSPDNAVYRLALIENLERSRYGDEGAHIQEAYEALCAFLDAGGRVPDSQVQTARQICIRVGDYERLARLGSFAEVGRAWARQGLHAPFLQHIGRVRAPEDRFELLAQHKIWGDRAIAQAALNPIARPATPRAGGKIRLGFLSSDLRQHPVAYFAAPVFEFIDRERFEVFCYSFSQGAEDATQKYIADQVTAFRWVKSISDRDAAQMVADDQLDMLFELGGSTHMNKLEVMAYRPAPLQASWLGYPHSAGLTTIDYLLTDPFNTPEKPGYLLEQPLAMPRTWISLGTQAFRETDVVNPQIPEERNGFVTFGTANNPHKYGPEMLAVWAKVLAAVPNSQFLFIRPEGGARSFRENMTAAFAKEGVAAERVRFAAVRGRHLPHYNEIDIALDTFPLTGGTTTCETLWMGVPVVSLLGEAFFERLSHSILGNAGLGDLVARTVDGYVEAALQLAKDPDRRRRLRANLRTELKASPLGQREAFARDFYDLVARTVSERLGAR